MEPIKNKFMKEKSVGYVNIILGRTHNQRIIDTNSEFFHSPVIFKETPEGIRFEKPNLGYGGKTLSPVSLTAKGWYRVTIAMIQGSDIPLGKFFFDEEDSNEDVKVIYFEEVQ